MKSDLKLVRWIMVVTLGCSLGLLLVFIVLSTRPAAQPLAATQIVRHMGVNQPPLQISEGNIEQDIRGVIESQLAAFREDDYPRAFTFAAATLRAQMTLPTFERMVKAGYPLIAQSKSVQFGVMLDNGDHALVDVIVAGEGGQMRHYQYILQRERLGWKIAGVTEVKPSGTTI